MEKIKLGEIIVGDDRRFPFLNISKRTVIFTVFVVCLILSLAGALYFSSRTAKTVATPVKTPQSALAYTLSQASQYDHAGNYQAEKIMLQTYIKNNPPKQYQYQPLMQMGTLAYNDRNYTQAITYFKQAESAAGKMQAFDAAELAAAYQAEGNKTQAIYYYQEAIKLTVVQPGMGNQIQDFKAAIKYMGGTTT